MSNECAPHPNTFSYVPSVFVSAQFCATESTEKVFLCTENTFSVLSAVALAVAAPAESALEFAREEHTAGPLAHTPAHLYDLDDPLHGLVDQTCLGDGNWGDDCDCDSGSYTAAVWSPPALA